MLCLFLFCKNELHINVLVLCTLVTCYILHSPGLGGSESGAPSRLWPDAWCTVHFIFKAKYWVVVLFDEKPTVLYRGARLIIRCI